MHLERLRAEITNGEWASALESALEAWRETRDDAFAALVDALQARAVTTLRVPSGAAFHRWWLKRAAASTAADRSLLLSCIEKPLSYAIGSPGGEVESPTALRMRLRKRYDKSPWLARVVDELLPWRLGQVGTVAPVLDDTSRIARLAALLEWPDDPRVARVLAGWVERRDGHGSREAAPDAFYRLLTERLAELRRPRSVGADHSAVAAQAGDLLTMLEGAPRATAALRLAALWSAVVAAKSADAPLRVLADAHLERGDPRGEFISLQLMQASAPSKKGEARIRQLLETHRVQWLGPLARIIDVERATFRRGLLWEIVIGAPRARAGEFVCEHPWLETLHKVSPGRVTAKNYLRFLSTPKLRFDWLVVDDAETLTGLPATALSTLTIRGEWTHEGLEHVDETQSALHTLYLDGESLEILGWIGERREAGGFRNLKQIGLALEQTDEELRTAHEALGPGISLLTPSSR